MARLGPVEMCSQALVAVGAKPIATFSAPSAGSIVSAHLYETIVERELSDHRWRFACRTTQLPMVGADPGHVFHNTFQLPAECLNVRAITDEAGDHVSYEVGEGKRILTDCPAVWAQYTRRVHEDDWPVYFRTLVLSRLEAHFIGALRKDIALRERMLAAQDSTGGIRGRARAMDAQEQPAPVLARGPVASARSGFPAGRGRRSARFTD